MVFLIVGIVEKIMIKTISERRLMNKPKSVVIEHTALEIACEVYDQARSVGCTSNLTQKAWARANFQHYIPHAIAHLTSMLGRSDINDLCKQEIYDAIIERTNDPEMIALENLSSLSTAEH